MMAICPAGPPNEMKPSFTQKRNASANETRRLGERFSVFVSACSNALAIADFGFRISDYWFANSPLAERLIRNPKSSLLHIPARRRNILRQAESLCRDDARKSRDEIPSALARPVKDEIHPTVAVVVGRRWPVSAGAECERARASHPAADPVPCAGRGTKNSDVSLLVTVVIRGYGFIFANPEKGKEECPCTAVEPVPGSVGWP